MLVLTTNHLFCFSRFCSRYVRHGFLFTCFSETWKEKSFKIDNYSYIPRASCHFTKWTFSINQYIGCWDHAYLRGNIKCRSMRILHSQLNYQREIQNCFRRNDDQCFYILLFQIMEYSI